MTKYLDNEGLTHFTGKMKEYADGKAGEVDSKVTTHVDNKKNPHGVTKEQVGLGSVDNVQQIPLSQRGAINGVATLDTKGKVPVEQMPTTKTINGASIFGSGNLQLSASLYKIVDALPTTGIDTSKIYLVPAESFTTNNYKTEYIYLGDPNKAYDESKWEKIGDEKTNNITPTPGGSITVDTAFNATSSNPIANKTVTKRFGEVNDALNAKVAQETYDVKMATIDSKLKTLENKTIDVDAELKVSTNPVQNTAVKEAVDDLNTAISKKANSTDLNAATGKITTLETNAATILSVTGEGNGISSISKSGNTITAKKGNFLTSAAGLATTAALNDGLAGKADVNHNHDTKYAAKKHTHPEYAQSSALNDYVTKTALDGKNFLTATSLNDYVNEVQPDGTSGNGIANITKEGKVLKVTKATFLTEHQSLAGYVNSVEVPTTDMMVQDGHAVAIMRKNGSKIEYTLKPFLNSVSVEDTAKKDGNGIAEISIDPTKKYILRAKKGKFITETTLGDAIDSYASNKGFLTKDDLNGKLKETITIKLVSDKSASDTNLNGVTVAVKSGGTVSTQTWQGTPIEFEVPCDKEATIEVGTVKMYMKPKALTYTPSPLYNREVTFTYKALETGVFIIDKNDKTYKTAGEFKNSGTDIKDVIGTLLVTDNAAIVVANYNSEQIDWGPRTLVNGCTVAASSSEAAQDFAGAANTAAIIETYGLSPNIAAAVCYNYIFGNGRRGHLMSAGEGAVIQRMCPNINSLMSSIGIDTNSIIQLNRTYWTSTQRDASSVYKYYMHRDSLEYIAKEYLIYVIPIYSLYD